MTVAYQLVIRNIETLQEKESDDSELFGAQLCLTEQLTNPLPIWYANYGSID